MTTKVASPRPSEASPCASPDLRAAYQAHTLVQMMVGQLAQGQTWPVDPRYFSGPLSSSEPSPLSKATPWAGDERCGFAWTVPGWFR